MPNVSFKQTSCNEISKLFATHFFITLISYFEGHSSDSNITPAGIGEPGKIKPWFE